MVLIQMKGLILPLREIKLIFCPLEPETNFPELSILPRLTAYIDKEHEYTNRITGRPVHEPIKVPG